MISVPIDLPLEMPKTGQSGQEEARRRTLGPRARVDETATNMLSMFNPRVFMNIVICCQYTFYVDYYCFFNPRPKKRVVISLTCLSVSGTVAPKRLDRI